MLESVYEVNAHTNEVDDLHISCDGKQVIIHCLNLVPLFLYALLE